MRRLALVIILLVTLADCKERDPNYCPNGSTADGFACIDAPPGTGDHCTNDDGCKGDLNHPFCDKMVNGGTCVQCTPSHTNICMGSAPHCDLDTSTCVACVDDNDCGGTGVCLPTGGCADPSTVIHAVSTGGSTLATCGGMGAGNACTLDTALTLVTSPTRNAIKLDDAGPYISSMPAFAINNDAAIGLTIDARGATLHPNGLDNPVFTINSSKGVTILGGTIENAIGNNSDGIRCNTNATLTVAGTTIATNEEAAIDATNCTLTVRNAAIRNNSKSGGSTLFPGIQIMGGVSTISRSLIAFNRGGGIVVTTGKFEIVGNVFLNNGGTSGVVGGVLLNTTASGNRFEFNSITENKSDPTIAAGVICMVTATGFTAQNNIIWNNNRALGTAGIQISGSCSHAYSDIGLGIIPTINDAPNTHNNLNSDPSFVNDMTDLHLQAGSMVRGKANPGTDLTGIASKDIDGKPRAQPADLGAYIASPQ